MFFIAWKNLARERGRFLLSIGGVAFSVLLIVVIGALYQGWNTRITEYIASVDADLWVGQKGTKDMFHSFSLVPRSTEGELKGIPGVRSVRRFIGRTLGFSYGEEEIQLYVVGFDAAAGEGGPVRLVKGSGTPGEREIIIDRVLAKKRGLRIGDTLPILSGEEWKIIGIADGGNQVIYTYAFADIAEVDRIFNTGTFANYFLVQTERSADREVVRERIDSALDVRAVTKETFLYDNQAIIRDSFLPIIFVLFLIAFGIGATVIGLTIFTATVERASEYGVLKAIGFDVGQLYRIVLMQSFISSLIGYIFGVILALALSRLVVELEPSFLTQFRLFDVALAFFVTLLMALLAAWAPTRRIAAIDPAETFRA